MTWKKIIKTAKKFNTPVIITDDNGENPLVVISLEKYDELLSQSDSKNSKKDTFESVITDFSKTVPPSKITESAFEQLPAVDKNLIKTEASANIKDGNNLQNQQKNTTQTQDFALPSDLSPEESFYFSENKNNQ